ncbi:MAG: right-handed parallel beta-helix repeat-containing protein [Candidatus Aenigmarchaeota archaeon]|nr:right-handed parallel beta-helix repeat-containing protein [Candidatus Aenigmarchaeota archaeon]
MVNGTYQNNNTLRFTNYTVNASLNGYTANSTEANITNSKSITLILQFIPLPPSNVCNLNTGICNDTIQKAINSAGIYDVLVIVNSTVYNESLIVNKTGLTLTANTSNKPMVLSNISLPTINITADNVTIRNLTIVYNGSSSNFGAVTASGRINITIANNTINNTGGGSNGYGVFFNTTNYSTVENNSINTLRSASNYGVYFLRSSNNIVRSNNISAGGSTGSIGIDTDTSVYNLIDSNVIFTSANANANYGIYVDTTNSSTVSNNIILTSGTGNDYGILISPGFSNYIYGNNITTRSTSSASPGIYLSSSGSNVFKNNNVSTNRIQSYGIRIHNSGNNTFYDSFIDAPLDYDVFLTGTTAGNNNFFINVSFNKSDINASSASVATKLFIQYRFDATVTVSRTAPRRYQASQSSGIKRQLNPRCSTPRATSQPLQTPPARYQRKSSRNSWSTELTSLKSQVSYTSRTIQ